MIRGALRAERPELLTVVLPQSLSKQPQESQELLKEVGTGGKGMVWRRLLVKCVNPGWLVSRVSAGLSPSSSRRGAGSKGLQGLAHPTVHPTVLFACLLQVQNLISMPQNDELTLMEASR